MRGVTAAQGHQRSSKVVDFGPHQTEARTNNSNVAPIRCTVSERLCGFSAEKAMHSTPSPQLWWPKCGGGFDAGVPTGAKTPKLIIRTITFRCPQNVIPFHFHAESEEYVIFAYEGAVALVANAKLTSSSTFRSRRDWSEPQNLGIKFPVIRHFSSSLQNAYSSEELNGLLYCQNSIFFQLQGGFAPLTSWTGALPLDPAGGGSAPRLPVSLPRTSCGKKINKM